MPCEQCGDGFYTCKSCIRSAPYGRQYYHWEGDWENDEDDSQPDERDLRTLSHDLNGRECVKPLAFDDRAGEPKRPNTTGGGYRHGGPRVGVAFRQGYEPKNPEKFVKALPKSSAREYFLAEPIDYSLTGSPLRANSPGRSEHEGNVGYENVFMYHSTFEPPTAAVTIPTATPKGKPPFAVLDLSNKVVVVTKKTVLSFSSTRQSEGTQTQSVMGLSAFDAAQRAGLTPTDDWAWLHLLAYSLGGLDGRTPDCAANLVAGTARSNYYHLAIESAAKKVVNDHDFPVQITVAFSGYTNAAWHIVEFMDYEVASAKNTTLKSNYRINCHSTKTGYGGDTTVIYKQLCVLFGLKSG